ncbi:MAG TPA: DUF6624 domain-containing protein [Mucilaginibacter sp.]
MKNTLLLIACNLLIATFALAQDVSQTYSGLVSKGDSLYNAKDYKSSAFTYSKAFKINGWKATSFDRYNAACSWALANYPDSAFSNLELIAVKDNYDNYDHITTDPDLKQLHTDKRWTLLIDRVKKNVEKEEANLDKKLVAELKTILKDDQGPRQKIDSVGKKYGNESAQMNALWKEIGAKDSVNLVKVKAILDKRGWLGPNTVGRNGAKTLFLVIQHSDQKIQEKYLPGMREAVKKGNADPADLALLEDRVALEEGKKQIYGSQIGMDVKTGKYYIRPIEDEVNVDKRREAVGLEPLKSYAKRWNIIYQPVTSSK